MKVCRHTATFGQVHFGLLKEADNVEAGSAIFSKQSGEQESLKGILGDMLFPDI